MTGDTRAGKGQYNMQIYFSLENTKMFLWGLGLQPQEGRNRAEGKSSAALPLFELTEL